MNYSRYIPIISIVGDFIILNAILVFGFIIYDRTTESLSSQYLAFYAYLNIIWFILVFAFKAHTIDRNIKKKSIVLTYINIIVFFFFLFSIIRSAFLSILSCLIATSFSNDSSDSPGLVRSGAHSLRSLNLMTRGVPTNPKCFLNVFSIHFLNEKFALVL